ncbi:hypothetical protein EJ06DRAFT_529864 [Trichodelitschia bisporula]|uniref:Uncharacterized protein n=1 Tax=Trichodelitschia bisporula TaxID=703511 RepID=A0A6G1HXG7_9PEZI|nr:hypothetical protein EJ06DRAFT_529864 [Trichodelitschia bisporula]
MAWLRRTSPRLAISGRIRGAPSMLAAFCNTPPAANQGSVSFRNGETNRGNKIGRCDPPTRMRIPILSFQA